MLDCLVIGGGHSGLLCGYLLSRTGLSYLVVDASARPGDVWRQRPKNLHLFTSRQFCGLADVPMHGEATGFPSGAEFADHVERFARQKSVNLLSGSQVVRLARTSVGFVAELDDGSNLHAKTVVNAAGANQMPVRPAYADQLDSAVQQLTAPEFRDAKQFRPGSRIAVVGDGASGRQIAQELIEHHQVILARGRKRNLVRNTFLGRDLFWWLSKVGILFAGRDTLVAKIMKKRDPVPAASVGDRQLRRLGVQLKPRALAAENSQLQFADASVAGLDVVIWCIGYQENLAWLDLPAIHDKYSLTEGQGRTPEPGLFVVGRKWLTCRASELILGAERDASKVVDLVQQNIQQLTSLSK